MDLRQLPPALRRELVELQRSFGGRVEIVVPGVALVVRLRLRGAPLTLETDLDTWPDEAPTLTLDAGWFWVHEEARLSSASRPRCGSSTPSSGNGLPAAA